jgi:hypothetical protein
VPGSGQKGGRRRFLQSPRDSKVGLKQLCALLIAILLQKGKIFKPPYEKNTAGSSLPTVSFALSLSPMGLFII